MADLPITSNDGALPIVINDPTTIANVAKVLTSGALSTDNSSWLGSISPTVGSKTSANSIPVVIASDQTGLNTFLDKSGSSTISALNGTVTVATNGCSSVVFNILGTWVATLRLQATVDGTNWFISDLYTTPGQGAPSYGDITVNTTIIMPCGGFLQVRLIAVAYTSGTINIAYDPSAGTNVFPVTNYQASTLNATVTQGPSSNLGNSWFVKQVASTVSTYSSAVNALTPPATPTDMVTITGSATTTIRVLALIFSATQTLAGTNIFFIVKRSAANTGGTSATPTIVPWDSNNTASGATVRSYTANPTGLGAAVGTLDAVKLTTPATGALINNVYEFDFTRSGLTQGVVLRGVAQVLALNFNGAALPGGLSVDCTVIWTEE